MTKNNSSIEPLLVFSLDILREKNDLSRLTN
jgi:hypothetical protein